MTDQRITRGRFLQLGTAAAMTVAGAGAGTAVAARPRRQELLSRSTFVPQLRTTFRVKMARAGAVPITLIEVGDPRPAARRKGAPPEGKFSLLFRGGADRFEQGTYTLAHRRLGKLTLLVVPVDLAGAHSQHYQAIVNRMPS